MKKPTIQPRHSPVPYTSYIVGLVLSVITTLVAYLIVVHQVFAVSTLIYVVLIIAVVQLIVQMIFFLHLGRGSKWQMVTFIFTIVFVLIVVIGTIWVMHHLDYNMMHMSPEEMTEYMDRNQGL